MNKKTIRSYAMFREQFNLKYEDIEEVDGKKYFRGQLVEDEEKKYAEGDDFLNIGYGFKLSLARVLSNLYPMEFVFRGKKVKSIEGVLQGIKHKDKKTQNLVLNYFGLDAYHTRASNTLDFWGNEGVLYWQGKPMKRDSEDYQEFLDELYLSAVKNPLYRKMLIQTGDKYLLHHIGNTNQKETVLTRYEYEQRLNSIREWVRLNAKY